MLWLGLTWHRFIFILLILQLRPEAALSSTLTQLKSPENSSWVFPSWGQERKQDWWETSHRSQGLWVIRFTRGWIDTDVRGTAAFGSLFCLFREQQSVRWALTDHHISWSCASWQASTSLADLFMPSVVLTFLFFPAPEIPHTHFSPSHARSSAFLHLHFHLQESE